MSTGTRLPLAGPAHVAAEIYGQLAPSCVRLEAAGSIRRDKADVGDIEFVAIPRYREEPASLWGDTSRVSVLGETLAMLEGERPERTHSAMLERLAGGDRYVKLRHLASGMQVDLFLVLPPASWGVIFLIRTGPADYSQWLVTYARHMGLHVVGGRLHNGLGIPGREDCTCEVIPTPEEGDVYDALGLPWIEPSERRVP